MKNAAMKRELADLDTWPQIKQLFQQILLGMFG